jgi:hypothetical protein
VAIETAAPRRDSFSAPIGQGHGRRQRPRRGEHVVSRKAERACEKLDGTTRLWGWIAVVYAYVAFFALVVALRFFGRQHPKVDFVGCYFGGGGTKQHVTPRSPVRTPMSPALVAHVHDVRG